ncbi:MAG: hypothetical protein KDC87_03475, partial [Planctomycetes bacterium]|nr:hypothetical protein [Planctomycetota bacterium]
AEQEGRLSKILAHYCSHFALVHMRETSRENELEFAYRVRLVDPLQSPGMVSDIGRIDGVRGLQLLLQDDEV